MSFRTIAKKLHLWLGLITGGIVFIVCLTGAIWAFNIHGWIGENKQPTNELSASSYAVYLKPSAIAKAATDSLQGQAPVYLTYAKGEVAQLGVYGKGPRISLTINPHTGEVGEVKRYTRNPSKNESFDFWIFIRRGHRSLWLPTEIGRPIINYATLSFVILLITGIVLWFPKNKQAIKNKLWFNWKKTTGIRRKLFDLHTVLGFYFSFFLIAIALTGMVWGLPWWSKGLYALSTGGKELPAWNAGQSDSATINRAIIPEEAVDHVFEKMIASYPHAASIQITYPDTTNVLSVIRATVYPERGKYYNSDNYIFDRYTLQEIALDGPYSGKYVEKSAGEKLRRMNYDIHIGSVWGNFGRILAILAALFGASLPLTGIYLLIKKRWKKKR